MQQMNPGEVVYWRDLDAPEILFKEDFSPGEYVAWAKGVIVQDRPTAPVQATGGGATLLFGVDPSQTLDSCSIDLGPARPGTSQLLTGAFALQAVFQVGQVRTLQFQAHGYGAAHVVQVGLMVMCVERVKTIIGK